MTLPGGMGIARFTANAAGAALGINLGNKYVLPSVPASVTSVRYAPEVILGACALLGAMVGNAVYSKVAGA